MYLHLGQMCIRDRLQAFRALLAVVFGIDRQTNVLIQCIIQHQRAEVLDGIQRVAAAADDRAHIDVYKRQVIN